MKPRAWLCWSSGKDSAWALEMTRRSSEVEVVGLLAVISEPYGRVSMHGVREEVLLAQAEAVGLPLHRVRIPAACSHATYGRAMRRAIEQAAREGIQQMVFGDLFLDEVRAYREAQLSGTGLSPRFPLWGRPTGELAREMIDAGLVALITTLDPARVPRELAGRAFDRPLLARLPAGVDPCAEHGEFHTCVIDGPMFAHGVQVDVGEVITREGFVFADLMLAEG